MGETNARYKFLSVWYRRITRKVVMYNNLDFNKYRTVQQVQSNSNDLLNYLSIKYKYTDTYAHYNTILHILPRKNTIHK